MIEPTTLPIFDELEPYLLFPEKSKLNLTRFLTGIKIITVKEAKMNKKILSKDKEFTIVLKGLRSEFRTFGEGLSALRAKVEAIFEMTGKNTEDTTFIKTDLRIIKNDLKGFDKRVSALEESAAK